MAPKRPDNHRPLSYVLFKKFGLRGALRILREDVGFDLRYRVNTAAPVSRAVLFPRGQQQNQNRYVASTFGVLDAVLNYVSDRIDLSEAGFVDLGSGKGKALIAASHYNFLSIRGVEVSPVVNDIARKNLQSLALLSRIELVSGSAADLKLQPHERVFYFFNSFTGSILQHCLENIASVDRDGPGIFIYINPTESEQVDAVFELLATDFIQPGDCEVKYYKLC